MLQMRPGCECCDKDLPADAGGAWICSFECTFCGDCVETRLAWRCPNCGGAFSARPMRVGGALERNPAQLERVFKPGGCAPN
ncbi:DUF1272 domain-containing protein [Massilia glaciei]|uniref:DUF1272 domain-containing protein n=1 Tax=Massilia glaciei TaxID=1524097 RepID=A0A2U2I7D0_9BURK|nr:DUF1272 domain-containing protein [Massilia glaciei]PWF55652.1 DUF1272 domain-containing protein [Massilia glaciei]